MFLISIGLINSSLETTAQAVALPGSASKSPLLATSFSTRNILDSKVGVFKLLTSLLYRKMTQPKLFPSLFSVHNLANSSPLFPKACAADDLELSLSGPSNQIEFFDNFVISNNSGGLVDSRAPSTGMAAPSRNGIGIGIGMPSSIPQDKKHHDHQHQLETNSGSSSLASSGYLSHEHQSFDPHDGYSVYEASQSYQSQQQIRYLKSNTVTEDYYPTEFHQHHLPQRNDLFDNKEPNYADHGHYSSQYGFNTNEIPQVDEKSNSPYFEDFNIKYRPGFEQEAVQIHEQNLNDLISSASSVSSGESYISPLDDEFFRKLSSNYNQQTQAEIVDFQVPAQGHRNSSVFTQSQQFSKKRNFDSVSSVAESNFSFTSEFAVPNQASRVTSIVSLPANLESEHKESNLSRKFAKKDRKLKDKKTKRMKKEDEVESESNANAVLPSSVSSENEALSSKNAFQCEFCSASFKVKGYLTRHLKKHSTAAFSCPFYQEPTEGSTGTKCHPTGGFSRRDTYKTHLKALHFIYPPGTKSSERNSISGRCAGCFEYFENNFVWLEKHIESGTCKGSVQHRLKYGSSGVQESDRKQIEAAAAAAAAADKAAHDHSHSHKVKQEYDPASLGLGGEDYEELPVKGKIYNESYFQ